jgi:hypothetical protein
MPSLTINRHYNLSLYPNSVLGNIFNNIKLVSILDYTTALKFSNVELLQTQIRPYLPPGTNLNHHDYTYYLFSYKDKQIVIADAWIIPTSIEETSGSSYTIRLNNITNTQLAIVRDQLRLLGISFDML